MKKSILVIGGTGAQGVPVVKAFASDSEYTIRVLTRTSSSKEANELSALPGVTIFEGNPYDEPTLRQAIRGMNYIFVNTNGFAIGEKSEIYWGIRMYELAREFGVEHFIYASLEYGSKLGQFNRKYRCGHLDAKGKVAEFIAAQPTTWMAWTILTSCMYLEGLSEMLRPFPDPGDPGTLVFAAPLGAAKCPLIHLEDYGWYARWIIDHPTRSNGLNLHVGTEDIEWKELAAAFTEFTGQKAVYKDVTLDEYFRLGVFPEPDAKLGHAVDPLDTTLFTYRENFSGFWNVWKDELTKRDYELLDEILPTRVKSVREWMEKVGYSGKATSILKDYRDNSTRQSGVKVD